MMACIHLHRRAAGIVRRQHRRRSPTPSPCRRRSTRRRSSSPSSASAIFANEWLCVGRREPHPRTSATSSPRRSTTSGSSSRVARTVRCTPSRRSASTVACRSSDGAGNCSQVHLPVPPVELRPHGPPARRAGDGAHEGLRQEGVPAAGLEGRAVEGASSSSTSIADADALGPTPAPRTSRTSTNYDLENAVCPGTFTLHDLPVELEGDVRELQRRLPRQQAPPHDPGLLPERARRVPGRVERRLQRHVPHQRLHAHRRRVQRAPPRRCMPIFPNLTEEERWRSTFALMPPTAELRHRA